jgi:hypothetical protein
MTEQTNMKRAASELHDQSFHFNFLGEVMNKQLGKAAVSAALAIGTGAGFMPQASATPGVPTVDATQESMENFNYGVCRGTDPTCYHDWGVARATSAQYPNGKVLL